MTKEVMRPVSAAPKSSPRVGANIERFGVKAITPVSTIVEKAKPRIVTTMLPRGEMAQPFLRSPFENKTKVFNFSERKVPRGTFLETRQVWKAPREKVSIKKPVMSFPLAREIAFKQKASPGFADRKIAIGNKAEWKTVATPRKEQTIFSIPIKIAAEQKRSMPRKVQARQEVPDRKRFEVHQPTKPQPRISEWRMTTEWGKTNQSQPEVKRVRKQYPSRAVAGREQQWPVIRPKNPEWKITTESRLKNRENVHFREKPHHRIEKSIVQPRKVKPQSEVLQRQQQLQEVRRQLTSISQAKPRKEQALSVQQKSREQRVVSLQQLQERLKIITTKKDQQPATQSFQDRLQAKMVKRQRYEQQQVAKLREKQTKEQQKACATEKQKQSLGYTRDENINRRRIQSLKMIFKQLYRNNQPVEAKAIAERIPRKQPSLLKSWIVDQHQDDHSLEWFKMDFGQARKIRSAQDIDVFATYSTQKYPAASIVRGKSGDLSSDYVNKYVYGHDFVKPKDFTE